MICAGDSGLVASPALTPTPLPAGEGLSASEASAVGGFGGFERVLHQGGHGHRPDAAGHRRDPAGALGCAGETDVADQAAVLKPVDADVDDHRALLNPVAGNQPRP